MRKNNTDALNEQYGESSFETVQDARDVDKAFEEWVKITPDEKTSDWPRLTKAFAKFYAQRCGVVFMESMAGAA